jgi:hypothetical protein
MTTMAENERLAVLENQYHQLQVDVTEIKSDVKSLVAQQAALATALAVKQAKDERAELARGTMGVWMRSLVPWLLMALGLTLTLINTLEITVGSGN